jgi:hypothetical protein
MQELDPSGVTPSFSTYLLDLCITQSPEDPTQLSRRGIFVLLYFFILIKLEDEVVPMLQRFLRFLDLSDGRYCSGSRLRSSTSAKLSSVIAIVATWPV